MTYSANKTVVIKRDNPNYEEQGTFGKCAIVGTDFKCFSMELPWKDNKSKVSCIPAGEYLMVPVDSPKFGRVYLVKNVPGRSAILNHSATFAGDKEKQWKCQLLGCIALGLKKGVIKIENGKTQKCLFLSKAAVKQYNDTLGGEPVKLIIC